MKCTYPACDRDSSHNTSPGISFHRLPEAVSLRAAWMQVLGQVDWEPKPGSVICSEHFLKEDGSVDTDRQHLLDNDENCQMCRICFATDNKMYSLTSSKVLNEAYETLTGILTGSEQRLPRLVCAECADRLMNCARFRRRSLRARSLLLQVAGRHGRITVELVRSAMKVHDSFSSDIENDESHIINDDHNGFDDKESRELNRLPETQDDASSGDVDVYRNVNDNKLEIDDFDDIHIGEDRTNKVNDVKTEKDDDFDVNSVNLDDEVIKDIFDRENVCLFNLNKGTIVEDVNFENYGIAVEDAVAVNEVTCNNRRNDDTVRTVINKEFDMVNEENAQAKNSKNASIGEDVLGDCVPSQAVRQEAERATETSQEPNELKIDDQQPPEADGPTDDTFRCDICPYQTDVDIQLLEHLKEHARTKESFNCDMCDFTTVRKNEFNQHCRDHFEDKGFWCDLCKKELKYKSTYQIHMRRHSGKRPYSCSFCNKKFFTISSLNRHTKIHSRGKPYICRFCNKQFDREDQLTAHLAAHSGEKPYSCHICRKAFKRKYKLKSHLTVHSDEKPFSCDICMKSFKRRELLQLHLITHTSKKTYSCVMCKKKFKKEISLMSHLTSSHSGEKYYVCDVCKRVFKRKEHITNHFKTHSGEKPYSCDVCKKTFSRKYHLRSHVTIHFDEKPYVCDICNVAFRHVYSLKNHITIHAGEKPFSCDICNKTFRLQRGLKSHLVVHYGLMTNVCKRTRSQSNRHTK